ncbi:fructose PTS transporter subunit IIA [Lactobacillus terrae]|uniref:fructose PTS transporter subunit IIA n=1 Tax=Lactobacillus terrae TaxID=2269374 RepID=UPI000C1B606E|nr:fructose PTS transporter subunit IIA [Lactobacillus terrae]
MNIIDADLVNLDLDLSTQDDVFKYLANSSVKNGRANNVDSIYQGLIEREKESTTGFGKGIAIPHTKNSAVIDVTVAVIRTNNLIEWNSLDGKPVNTMINLLVPDNQADEHLKLLAKLSRQLMHEDFTNVLKNGTKEEILEIVNNVITN